MSRAILLFLGRWVETRSEGRNSSAASRIKDSTRRPISSPLLHRVRLPDAQTR